MKKENERWENNEIIITMPILVKQIKAFCNIMKQTY